MQQGLKQHTSLNVTPNKKQQKENHQWFDVGAILKQT